MRPPAHRLTARNVRQKAGLHRAILDKGWHRFERALRHAARHTGGQILLVHAAHPSQTCNRCGHVEANSRKSQAAFECTACGHRDHAEVNAATNQRDAGLAFPACGDLGAGLPRATTGKILRREPRARERSSTAR